MLILVERLRRLRWEDFKRHRTSTISDDDTALYNPTYSSVGTSCIGDGVSEKILKDWASLKELPYLIKKGGLIMIYQHSLYPNCIMFSYGEFKPSESHQNGAPAYFGAEKVTPFTWLIFYFLRSGNWLWGDFLPARLELTSLLNSCNRLKGVQPSKQIRFWKRNAPRLKETFIVCYCCAYCLCWGKFRLKKIRKQRRSYLNGSDGVALPFTVFYLLISPWFLITVFLWWRR